ncbi:MAG: hypothetical protein ACLUVC_09145 [Longibaculum sp.]
MIDEEFNTEKAQEYIELLEDGEDIYQYLQSDQYFKTFKNQLETMINDKQLDRQYLNDLLGRVNLNNWLSGKVIPNRQNLIKICFALKCNQEECDLLMSKFAGDQKLNSDDLEDAVHMFCLAFQMDYNCVQEYMEAKDMLLNHPEDIDSIHLDHKERFIHWILPKIHQNESNKDKKIKTLKNVIEHPQIYLGEFNETDGLIKPIAEFIYNEADYQKSIDRIHKMLSGRLPIKRNEFLKLIIACGYSSIEDINQKMEEAGFYPLYPRNQFDCICISGSINAMLNNEPSLADYLIELSKLFKQFDLTEYVIYDVD